MIIITNEDIWYGYSLYVDWIIFFFQINAMYWFSKFFLIHLWVHMLIKELIEKGPFYRQHKVL